MKRLILMRHAKSDRNNPALDDHACPLNGRGRASARLLGDWLRHRCYIPDQAFVSDAARARETFARLGLPCDTAFLPELYLAEPEEMLRTLRRATGACLLMVGHNPGIGWFAQGLVTDPPPHPRFFDYPTGATLVADFDLPDWEAVGLGCGRAIDFIVPRDLTG